MSQRDFVQTFSPHYTGFFVSRQFPGATFIIDPSSLLETPIYSILYKSLFPPVADGSFGEGRGFSRHFLAFRPHRQDHVHVIDMNLYDTLAFCSGDGGRGEFFIRMGEEFEC